MKNIFKYSSAILFLSAVPFLAGASENAVGVPVHNFAFVFLSIAILLVFAKISGLVEKIGQPAVLGE
ncbi:MAG: hypothetical protein Q8P06_02190, partial [Candidatus Azambacteria bacterium]|nr:hypothetical protein [Candidatus Azambacteria bacterium]